MEFSLITLTCDIEMWVGETQSQLFPFFTVDEEFFEASEKENKK